MLGNVSAVRRRPMAEKCDEKATGGAKEFVVPGAVVFFHCRTAQEVTVALAKNDVLRSFVGETGTLQPGDDFYTTPFAALRLVCRGQVFTGIACCVYKVRSPHFDARTDMGTFGHGIQLCPNGLSDLSPKKTIEMIEFMPGAECVEPSLERDQAAMEVTCRMLGVEPQPDWQATRASLFEAHRCKAPRGFGDAEAPINEKASGSIEAIRAQPRCACGNYSRFKEVLCNACHKAAGLPAASARRAGQ